jgi:proline utilization trans-activator
VSSAFVFVLVESTHLAESPQSGYQGIISAAAIMKYLSENGNKAAERKLKVVRHLCEHLGIILQDSLQVSGGLLGEPIVQQHTASTATATQSNALETLGSGPLTSVPDAHPDCDWRRALSFFEASNQSSSKSQLDSNSLWNTPDGLNFDFNDDFMLTGADETDWEQFERQILQSNQ